MSPLDIMCLERFSSGPPPQSTRTSCHGLRVRILKPKVGEKHGSGSSRLIRLFGFAHITYLMIYRLCVSSYVQYFMEILLQQHSPPSPSKEDESDSSDSSDSTLKISTPSRGSTKKSNRSRQSSKDMILACHALIQSISRQCPTILLSTLPVLESELENIDAFHRTLAVQSLGGLFGGLKGSEIVSKAPKTWRFWLDRSRDAEPKVRRIWVEQVGKIMGVAGAGGTDLKAALEREYPVLP